MAEENIKFVEIEDITKLKLEELVKSMPGDMSKEVFFEKVIKDLIKKETAREALISPERTIYNRVVNTLETIKSFPYFSESQLQVYAVEDGRSKLVASFPEGIEKKLEGEGVLSYDLNEFKNNVEGELIIKPKTQLTRYEENFLKSLIETMTLHIKNARDYEQQVLKDSLTGLYNRHLFNPTLDINFATAIEKSNEGLSLILIDMDNLKKVNDNHPLHHRAGDILLKGFSSLLKGTMSKGRDSIYRLSGDEFAILMPMTRMENAYDKAERIRDKVQKQHFTPSKSDDNLREYRDDLLLNKYPPIMSTISLGVSHSDYASSPIDLVDDADRALYEAKKTKNKVVCLHN